MRGEETEKKHDQNKDTSKEIEIINFLTYSKEWSSSGQYLCRQSLLQAKSSLKFCDLKYMNASHACKVVQQK